VWTCGCGPDGTLGEICISGEGARPTTAAGARLGKADADQARISAGETEPGAALLESWTADLPEHHRFSGAVEAVTRRGSESAKSWRPRNACPVGLNVNSHPEGIRISISVQCCSACMAGREPVAAAREAHDVGLFPPAR